MHNKHYAELSNFFCKKCIIQYSEIPVSNSYPFASSVLFCSSLNRQVQIFMSYVTFTTLLNMYVLGKQGTGLYTVFRSDRKTFTKGQLISKGLFVFSNFPKKRTKNFCPSRLGQRLTFSSSFFGRIEDTKISFRD